MDGGASWYAHTHHFSSEARSPRCQRREVQSVESKFGDVPSRKLTDGNGKSPFLIGDTSSNGCFSIVMLVFGGVVYLLHPSAVFLAIEQRAMEKILHFFQRKDI